MAGRGRRGENEGLSKRPGDESATSVEHLIEKIEEISVSNINPGLLYETESIFKQLCTNYEAMKEVMIKLHCKALTDSMFGEKYVTALGQVSNFVVDNVPVRSELLTYIENDFKVKDDTFQSDDNKFINSVTLLGNVYNIIKIHGVPLKVLGAPMLEYMDLLIQGKEQHHKVLAMQIILNGEKILMTENLGKRYGLLKNTLRKAIVERDLSSKSRCWILLALDHLSNNLKPLNGLLREFYVENLGDDYLHMELILKQTDSDKLLKECVKNQGTNDPKGDIFKDIENLTIPPEIINDMGTKSKISRFNRFELGSRSKHLKEKEHKQRVNEKKTAEANEGANDEDDEFYGIQIDREKITKSLGKKK